MSRSIAAVCAVVLLCVCAHADVGPIGPPPRRVKGPKAAPVRTPKEAPLKIVARGGPLIIEVALVPEPGSDPCDEAPAIPGDYFREVADCLKIGASIVRVQPLAPDSGPEGCRYDRSLANYREIVKGVLQAAPGIILDVDLERAPREVIEWARCNGRIELCAPRGRRTLLTPASGRAPLEAMRKIIAAGGHLRLGLRESRGWPHKGNPTNLDYLRQAVSMAHALRRPIATPEQARRMLGLKPLAPLYVVPSGKTIRAGEKFSLDAIAQPLPAAVRGYAIVVAPDGKKYSLREKGRLLPGVGPFISDPEGIKILFYTTLVDTVLNPATHPGVYTIHFALVPLHSIARAETALAIATETVTIE